MIQEAVKLGEQQKSHEEFAGRLALDARAPRLRATKPRHTPLPCRGLKADHDRCDDFSSF